MARPDPGPLLDEHLDELELIVRAGENGGAFAAGDSPSGDGEQLCALDYMLGWHDRHDRKLLEAARWALAHGWARSLPAPPAGTTS